jgi:hypothetical protein
VCGAPPRAQAPTPVGNSRRCGRPRKPRARPFPDPNPRGEGIGSSWLDPVHPGSHPRWLRSGRFGRVFRQHLATCLVAPFRGENSWTAGPTSPAARWQSPAPTPFRTRGLSKNPSSTSTPGVRSRQTDRCSRGFSAGGSRFIVCPKARSKVPKSLLPQFSFGKLLARGRVCCSSKPWEPHPRICRFKPRQGVSEKALSLGFLSTESLPERAPTPERNLAARA